MKSVLISRDNGKKVVATMNAVRPVGGLCKYLVQVSEGEEEP